ncbi:hypothetical protein [Bifidobacterium sp. ESL0745]|uniref:hypothetical protein n=1 Tax=Bifidobacterium sp. ESL0745 TaxID=2983226 RepID=UPI0023F63B21|nr:hypothetical protein [Bifidobacterium sp. ESL0745]MDF7665786.1 hypothetical protein [Bifidobacterium sp. ESL0745]
MTEEFFIHGYEVSFNIHDGGHGVHVHVSQGRSRDMAKFILAKDGNVVLSHDKGKLSPKMVRAIQVALMHRYPLIVNSWDKTFGEHHFDK